MWGVGIGAWYWHIERHAAPPRGSTLVQVQAAAIARSGSVVSRWRLGARLPSGWTAEPGAGLAAAPGGALALTTTSGRFAYQLLGPKVRVDSGNYAVSVAGAVVSGGLELGVLDARRNVWIATGTAHRLAGGRLVVGFSIDQRAEIQPILANFAERDSRSRWTVRAVTVRRGG